MMGLTSMLTPERMKGLGPALRRWFAAGAVVLAPAACGGAAPGSTDLACSGDCALETGSFPELRESAGRELGLCPEANGSGDGSCQDKFPVEKGSDQGAWELQPSDAQENRDLPTAGDGVLETGEQTASELDVAAEAFDSIQSWGDAPEESAGLPPSCLVPPSGPAPGKTFPLGIWYHWIGANGDEAHDRAYYQSSLADLAAHGIDLVVPVFVFGQNRVWLLEEADKAGLEVIMGIGEMSALLSLPGVLLPQIADPLAQQQAAPLQGLPALRGYYVADEPDIHNVLPINLLAAKQAFEKADPGHPSFFTFALLNEMPEYFLVVQPEVLQTDMYPLYKFITWPEAFVNGLHVDNFLSHVETSVALAGAKPTWLVLQAFGNLLQWRVPVFEEIRAMAYLAVNRGIDGLIYFLYQSVPDGEQLEGLLDLAGNPTDNWVKLAGFHEQFQPVRNALTWSQPASPFATGGPPFDLGFFKHELGFHYLLVVNRDVMSSGTALIDLPAGPLPPIVAAFDETTGEEVSFTSDAGGAQLSLAVGPGDARMVRLCTGE
jgi:hypothetical protein